MKKEVWVAYWQCPRCGRQWRAPKQQGPIGEHRPDCEQCGLPALWRGENPDKIEVV